MCVVSMIMKDWSGPGWPGIPTTNPSPNYIPWQTVQSDPALAKQMLDVLAKLEAIDARLGALERCIFADEEKAAIKAALKEIADKL